CGAVSRGVSGTPGLPSERDGLVATLPLLFFFNDPPTPEIYPLSLHDALPILAMTLLLAGIAILLATLAGTGGTSAARRIRSEEHTAELQSPTNLLCRLLL